MSNPQSTKTPAPPLKPQIQNPKSASRSAIQRHGSTAGSPGKIVTYANRWRENYNPLRQLSIAIAVSLLERGQRGDMALLQWTFRFTERRYPILASVLSRCESPLLNFDWEIKLKDEFPSAPPVKSNPQSAIPNPQSFADMAEAQRQTLKAAYERLDNLMDAIRHLHLAEFRGYAHLQKHRDPDGNVYHLETLDQWCICRDGLYGDWWWNPDSRSLTMPALVLGEEYHIGGEQLPLADFIIREVHRPIDEIGLINFVRANLCEKDWDAFIEIYGIPGGVVVMPPNVPEGKESEYESAAQQVAEGGSGAIPSGADYKANDGPRGVDPFTPRLQHLDEQVVLAGTGGKLTMLAESGSGTLAGGAHTDTFEDIAAARAAKISERFQRDFDAEVLAREHPGQPILAYFHLGKADVNSAETLAFKRDLIKGLAGHELLSRVLANQVDLKETVRDVGVPVNEEYTEPYVPVAESNGALVTGATIKDPQGDIVGGTTSAATSDPSDSPPPSDPSDPSHQSHQSHPYPITNRSTSSPLEASGKRLVVEALKAEFEHLNERLAAIAEITDPETQKRKLSEVLVDLDRFEKDLAKDPAVAQAIYKILSAGVATGLTLQNKVTNRLILNSAEQPRDSLGKWVDENGGGLSESDNIKRGNNALQRSLGQKADVQKAMYRPEVGEIIFPWGHEGTKAKDFEDGGGISKMQRKHPDELQALPVTLAKGRIIPHDEFPETKRFVIHGNNLAVLSKVNDRKAWAVTHFEDPRKIRELEKNSRPSWMAGK